MDRAFVAVIAAGISALLAGCGGPSATFAIGEPTAETAVSASRVPLHVPPEYALRPGADTTTPARPPLSPQVGLSTGESALLTMAGAADADPRIRALVDEESTSLTVVDPFLIERLVLGDPPIPPHGLTIERTGSRIIDDPLSLL